MGMFGWQCIVDIFSFNTYQSMNGPTLGDYKLQNPIEHTISDSCIIKEVVLWGRANELTPPLLKQCNKDETS